MTRLAGILHIVRIINRLERTIIDFLVDIRPQIYSYRRPAKASELQKMSSALVVFMQGLVERYCLIIGFADDLSRLTVSNKEHV